MSSPQGVVPAKAGTGVDRVIDGRDGPIRVRVHPAAAPKDDTPVAPAGSGLVWVHGGGFREGTLDWPEADYTSRGFAARGVTVVSVDYRLCQDNDTHFPAPSDDVVDAWEWTLNQASELGIDPLRLAIGGASAGGNLTAGAVIRLLEGPAERLPARVFLAYPTLHAVQPETPDDVAALLGGLADPDVFSAPNVLAMYENYLGGPVAGGPAAAIPGTASVGQLRGFPPTIMVNDEADELRVSGEAFGAMLAAAGIDVEVITEPGTEHGHLNRPEDGAADRTMDRVVEWLRRG
ncbi:alpha/beta hydrolase [Arthrobacter sp. M4]|uniref:alpha/beta hydrolase n=1 Tax=Arthrobacter sp. M4 TaxID=218160 RepID=UPI001CDD3948|nr:alpha/beta hydrolase fold domain-containing protein [Arthrobacter sp. M4]MCA4133436.1 alpha/beta hydrolase [Arthrobacter sp. M4]